MLRNNSDNTHNKSNSTLTRTISNHTDRSIITDANGRRYELIPRATLDELDDIRKAIPTVDIAKITMSAELKNDPTQTARQAARNFTITIGAGAHNKIRLAREINVDGSYGSYFVVKKAQSSEELSLKHSNNSNLSIDDNRIESLRVSTASTADTGAESPKPRSAAIEINPSQPGMHLALRRLSKLSTLNANAEATPPGSPRANSPRTMVFADSKARNTLFAQASSSAPNSPRITGDLKREEIFDSIDRELYVNSLLSGIKGICTAQSQTFSAKKREPEQKQLYQFMPFATLGDLNDFADIQKNVMHSTIELVNLRIHVSNQMIQIISHLHSNTTISHRDLKGENFVLDKDANVLLIDFGCASYLDKDNNRCLVSRKTTRSHQPPSILSNEKSANGVFNRIHDEWALAKSILELWQIDTDPLYDITVMCKTKSMDIQEFYTDYLCDLNTDMTNAGMPAHIQHFITAAIEINIDVRKPNIGAMINQADLLTSPDISSILARIHRATAARNDLFFANAAPNNSKYKITQAIMPDDNNMDSGYTDEEDMPDKPAASASTTARGSIAAVLHQNSPNRKHASRYDEVISGSSTHCQTKRR